MLEKQFKVRIPRKLIRIQIENERQQGNKFQGITDFPIKS